MQSQDQKYMQRALELAALGLGRTSPNPVVGAVLVKDGIIVGEGYHRQAGTPHAEIVALQRAGSLARGASIYVSLEPCCHHGKTPPCTEALIKAGVKRVIAATLDPNPLVEGKGAARLREAGIEVALDVLKEEADRLNEAFFKYIRDQRPFVTMKTAMTLDGKIASYSGDSRWISSEASRQYVHHLRNTYDAIMVGIGTVIADDPMLNTRLDSVNSRDPLRVILDGELRLPEGSKIAQTSQKQRTLLIANQSCDKQRVDKFEQLGIEVLILDGEGALLSLPAVLEELGRRKVLSLLLEGGAEVNAAMLENRLVDKIHWFIAPKIIGGNAAPGPVGGGGRRFMKEALELREVTWQSIGSDLLLTAYTGW